MSRTFIALALIMAAAPAAFAQALEPTADQAVPIAPTEVALPPAPSGFNSQVAFSPTYSSGYYYASPYSGYTSLAYYGSIYTARRFGG